MSEQDEPMAADPTAPAARHARAGPTDLLALLGMLVFAGALTLLVDRTGQILAGWRSPGPPGWWPPA